MLWMLVFSQRERDIFQARFQILWWSRSNSPIQRQQCFMSRHYLRDEDAFNRVGSLSQSFLNIQLLLPFHRGLVSLLDGQRRSGVWKCSASR
jgi:hypothetical protein